MKLVILIGPQAVGKMTVGQQLEKRTGLKLFHNHATIDLVTPFFDYSTRDGKALVGTIRTEMFKAIANSALEGVIFTFVWAFDQERDHQFMAKLAAIFEAVGADILLVELEAELEERLIRNTSANRLAHKPSKRDTDWSEHELRQTALNHRLNSREAEINWPNYLRMNNTDLSPQTVAQQIVDHFGL